VVIPSTRKLGSPVQQELLGPLGQLELAGLLGLSGLAGLLGLYMPEWMVLAVV